MKILSRILLLVFGLALPFVALEAGGRLPWLRAESTPPENPSNNLPLLGNRIDVYRQPNIRGRMKCGGIYRTNSFGFRGPEYARQKPQGVFRIIIAGDSVTAGACVEERETYASRLESMLNDRRDGRRYEVLNLGFPGGNIASAVNRTRRIGLLFDPDLIVYGWTINDIQNRAYVDQKELMRKWMQTYRRFEHSSLLSLRIGWPYFLSLLDLVYPQPGSYQTVVADNYFRNPQAWSIFTAGLDDLAEIGHEQGVCVVAFLHTHLGYSHWFHPFLPIYDRVGKAAEARGLHPVYSFEQHKFHRPESLWASRRNIHPNAKGHAILAQALYEGLSRLPPRCVR